MPGKQCVILVGGLGTRLGELTRDLPKPLLRVSGKPFLAHMIENALRFGFNDIVLLAGFHANKVAAFAEDFMATNQARVRVVVEPEPAGTAGALTYARDLLADEFLMLNGDSMFDFNWLDLASQCVEGEWEARLGLRHVEDTSRFGSISLEGTHVAAFREKQADTGPGLINGGVYWLRKRVLDHIKSLPCSLEQHVFPHLVEKGTIFGFPHAGMFIDIGVPSELERARTDWVAMRRKPAVFFDRDGVLNHDDGYTHRIDQFLWKGSAREAILRCNQAGFLVFVVTNQAGIARGYYDAAAVEKLHCWMSDDLRTIGAHIDDFRYCPHHPEGTVSGLAIACNCRKPAPGMIHALLEAWSIDTNTSFLVGDSQTDITAAQDAGIRGFLIKNDQDLVEFLEILFTNHDGK